MMRAISIVLIVAIALQTVGCSTWRPLVRANEVSEDNNPTSMLGVCAAGKFISTDR